MENLAAPVQPVLGSLKNVACFRFWLSVLVSSMTSDETLLDIQNYIALGVCFIISRHQNMELFLPSGGSVDGRRLALRGSGRCGYFSVPGHGSMRMWRDAARCGVVT